MGKCQKHNFTMGLAEVGMTVNIMGYLGNKSFLQLDHENNNRKPLNLKIRWRFHYKALCKGWCYINVRICQWCKDGISHITYNQMVTWTMPIQILRKPASFHLTFPQYEDKTGLPVTLPLRSETDLTLALLTVDSAPQPQPQILLGDMVILSIIQILFFSHEVSNSFSCSLW